MKRVEVHHNGDQNYADSGSVASVGSSPRSVEPGRGSITEDQLPPKWDDAAFLRVKLMCSYGGKILPRPHDNQLRYVGGETRIVVVNRNISYGELVLKLSKMFGASVLIKYQIPSEDLDALVSVTSDEDLENMMEECDRLQACNRSSRLRLFLFPRKIESQASLSDLLNSNTNREHWFVDALNGLPILSHSRSEASSVVSEVPDYLSGLDSLEDWNTNYHQLIANSPISYQNGAEKSSGASLLGSLIHGSGEFSSAPGSPMSTSAINSVPTASSAPPFMTASSAPSSMSSMPSSVVDSSLQRPHAPKSAAGELYMEEPSNVPIQRERRGSESQSTIETTLKQGSSGLRQQPEHPGLEASKIPNQRFPDNEITGKMDKLIPEKEKGVEVPVTSRPAASKPQLQPQDPFQQTNINVTKPEKHKFVDNVPLIDSMFDAKEENSRYQKEESARYTREDGPKCTRMVSKPPGELKQEVEVQKGVPILQGGEQIVKKASAGEKMTDPMRKFDDQNFSRKQVVEPEIDSFQQPDGFDSGSGAPFIGRGTPGTMDQNFGEVKYSQPQTNNMNALQGQEILFAHIGHVYTEPEDSASTYATQPPTVQLENLANPSTLLKNATPLPILPAQSPQVYQRSALVQQQSNATKAVYSEAIPSRPAAANPVFPPHLQRQTSDPIQQMPAGRVTSPYRDHPSAHALPSRFRVAGPPMYPTDMKRGPVRPAGPQAQQSKLPTTMQYTDQTPYIAHAAYVDPNTTYAPYGQFQGAANAQYAGLNPFVDDMRSSNEVPAARYQEAYAESTQDGQAMIDGRLQGRQYVIRN